MRTNRTSHLDRGTHLTLVIDNHMVKSDERMSLHERDA
jgi:hypothetical protein